MQEIVAKPPVYIRVTTGEDLQQHKLATINLHTVHGDQEINLAIKQSGYQQDIGYDDIITVINFEVNKGREQEAVEYFKLGIQGAEKAYLQVLAHQIHDKYTQDYQILSAPGKITIIYKFPLIAEPEINTILEKLQEFQSHKLELILKGQVYHKENNKVSVKVDYSRLTVTAEKMHSTKLFNALKEVQFFPPEISNNPFIDLLGKTRKVNLDLKFKSIRDIYKYEAEIKEANGMNYPKNSSEGIPNKGIFKDHVQAFHFIGKKCGAVASMQYDGEDALLRLLKKFVKAIKSVF